MSGPVSGQSPLLEGSFSQRDRTFYPFPPPLPPSVFLGGWGRDTTTMECLWFEVFVKSLLFPREKCLNRELVLEGPSSMLFLKKGPCVKFYFGKFLLLKGSDNFFEKKLNLKIWKKPSESRLFLAHSLLSFQGLCSKGDCTFAVFIKHQVSFGKERSCQRHISKSDRTFEGAYQSQPPPCVCNRKWGFLILGTPYGGVQKCHH